MSFHHSDVIPMSFRHSVIIPSFHNHSVHTHTPAPHGHILSSLRHLSRPFVFPSFLSHSIIPESFRVIPFTLHGPAQKSGDILCKQTFISSHPGMTTEWGYLSFEDHSMSERPRMTEMRDEIIGLVWSSFCSKWPWNDGFCHSDLILSFETKDERNEVDKVPFRETFHCPLDNWQSWIVL